jgi:hypothetical protein
MQRIQSRREAEAVPDIYLNTPEGDAWLRECDAVVKRIETRSEIDAVPEIPLTPVEEKALAFIRSELAEGRSPGVRKIAQVVGLKLSRSGLRILRLLKSKGVLE